MTRPGEWYVSPAQGSRVEPGMTWSGASAQSGRWTRRRPPRSGSGRHHRVDQSLTPGTLMNFVLPVIEATAAAKTDDRSAAVAAQK